MEIGVCEGNCVKHLIKEFPDIQNIVLCDTWGDTYGGSNRSNHEHISEIFESEGFPLERVLFLDGNSRDRIPEFFESHQLLLDVIFVDGDHSLLGCLIDITNCIKYCNILIVHDVRHPLYGHLKGLCYSFFDTIKDEFIMVDNGEYIIYFIRKDLFL
jgi:hypothetical protein